MTQEEKDLLLKDLSARLPYKVKCRHSETGVEGALKVISKDKVTLRSDDSLWHSLGVEDIKPYLFPLYSMTEGQLSEFNKLGDLTIAGIPTNHQDYLVPTICSKSDVVTKRIEITDMDIIPVIDWLNAHHFDYRGIIEKGLAIDATGLNIY